MMGLPPVLGAVEKRQLEMPPADFVRAVAEVELLVFATPPRKDGEGVDWLTGNVLLPALRAHFVRPNSLQANLSSLRSSQRRDRSFHTKSAYYFQEFLLSAANRSGVPTSSQMPS